MHIGKALIILFALFLLPSIALSHGSRFFEFAPDVSSELLIAEVETPTQPFAAINDTLDGIDLWLSNPGVSGDLLIEIRDSLNTLLSSKTVTLPAIADSFGGTRYHIDFLSKISVSSKKIYKLRMVSTTPNLKLYKANYFQILQHNTKSYPDYQVEPALLGSQSQDFAFKYALYETQESTPPIISNVEALILSPTEVKIEFNANEPVDFRLDFGSSGQSMSSTVFSGKYETCPEQLKKCSLNLGVLANTLYQYSIFAKDEWGNQSVKSGTFTTPQGPVPPPPPAPGSSQPPPVPPPPAGGSPPPPIGSTPPPPAVKPPPPPPTGGQPPPPPAGGSGGPPPSQNQPPPPKTGTGNPPPPQTTPPPPAGGGGQSGTTESRPGSSGETIFTNPSQTVTITVRPREPQPSQDKPVLPPQNSITIEWQPPLEIAQKSKGYIIKILDQNKNEVKEIAVDKESRKLVIEKIAEGLYRITVFANVDGSLVQVGEPVEIEVRLKEAANPFTPQRIAIVAILTLAGIFTIILILRKFRRMQK